MRKCSKLIRADLDFKKFLQKVNIRRIQEGRSKRFLSDRRLTKAITRIPGLDDTLVKGILNEDD